MQNLIYFTVYDLINTFDEFCLLYFRSENLYLLDNNFWYHSGKVVAMLYGVCSHNNKARFWRDAHHIPQETGFLLFYGIRV